MDLNRAETLALVEMLGTITLDQINTPVKRALVSKLFDVSQSSSNAVVLSNVAAKDAVGAIKTIRGLTGLGLKEAKDLYDSVDPLRMGGTLGPIALPKGRSFDDAMAGLRDSCSKYQFNSSIVVTPA